MMTVAWRLLVYMHAARWLIIKPPDTNVNKLKFLAKHTDNFTDLYLYFLEINKEGYEKKIDTLKNKTFV